jgi:hypothetical protein
VPVQSTKIQIVEKIIEVPVEVIKYVDREVPNPHQEVKIEIREVLKEVPVEVVKIVEVQTPYEVIKTVEVVKIVEKPVIQIKEIEKVVF